MDRIRWSAWVVLRTMVQEASAAGFYVPEHPTLQSMRYPRLQILTIKQLLAGQQPLYPRMVGVVTYRQAARRLKAQAVQQSLEGVFQAAEPPQPAYRVRRGGRAGGTGEERSQARKG